VADVVVQTDLCDQEDVFVRAVAQLGLYPRAPFPLVDVLVGAQYGSEGKGNIAAYLAREYGVLVRVGGPNAGHKVAFPKRTFIHLPSGTERNPDAKLIIGPGATIDVEVLLAEIQECQVDAARLSIDGQAMIIEATDKKWEEGRLGGMGSTKQGVGVATARKILGRDLKRVYGAKVRLARDLPVLAPYVRSTAEQLDAAYTSRTRILLEGTQGTSLSLHHGHWPHVTSRDTTTAGCLADAGIAPLWVRKVVMITRTYPIRVGGPSGYMKKEIDAETVARRCGLGANEIHSTEKASRTGRSRRIGEFDWTQLRRSATVNGPTDIALTFSDYLHADNQKARRYEQLNRDTMVFIEEVERVTGVPVSLISTRFHLRNIIDRRSW
jgi:adenylosuccinate synthase